MSAGNHEPVTDDELIRQLSSLDRTATVIVRSPQARAIVRKMIKAKLGNERSSQVTIVQIAELHHVERIEGRRGPIYIHASWLRKAGEALRLEVVGRCMVANLRPRERKLERSTRFEE